MRKIKWIALPVILLLVLAGCKPKDYSVNGHEWAFSLAQSQIDGSIVACHPDQQENYEPRPQAVDLKLQANERTITLSDGEQQWDFAYTFWSRQPECVNYTLSGEKAEGIGLVGITSYYNGQEEYEKFTLILNIGDYALHFYAE